MERTVEQYEQIPIFAGLSKAEIGRFLKMTEDLTAPAGKRLFSPGDPCDGFYIILDGRVEIRKPDLEQKGAEVRVAVLAARSIFGEMALVANRARSSAAIALEPVKLNRIPKADFDALIEAGDIPAYKIVRAFAKLITERLLAELQTFRQKLFSEWSF